MKALPASYSVKHRIGLHIHKNRTATMEQITGAIKGPRASYVKEQVEELVRDEFIFKGDDGSFHLSTRYGHHFAQIESAPVEAADVVPARTALPFKPLTVMPWAANADRLRDWSYKNGGTDFRALAGYQA